ncbi:MAG: flagellar basal-body MS-ring/collar protein FliF, partial [Planctomycetota bacterium]
MGFFEALGQQYTAVWRRLSAGHKVILVLLCIICIGSIVAVVFWAGQPDYQILYTDLSAKECASLVAGLKDAGVPVRIADGGSAVMVGSGSIHEARMAAAEKGVPGSARAGFDAFRDPKIGMTPFAERVNYISALQNELATTITSLGSVVYARVHLVVPERSLFKKDQRKAGASVLIVTKAGRRLPREQATGIVNLVASAVEGLAPEDVTLTDGRGNMLAGGGEDGPEMAADGQFAYRQRVESYLSEKAETMLSKVLGHGRCEVRVSAELDFEDSKETTRLYDPDKKVTVTERIESTKSTGSSLAVGGVVGAAGNVPGESPSAPGAASGPSQTKTTENIDTKYAVSESVMETVSRGAKIKRLAVAAFVDTSALQAEEGAEGATGASGPTTDQITLVIKDAVGFDESRGDSLNVVEAGFHPVTAELDDVGGGPPQWLMKVGEYFAIGVLALVLLFVARRVLKNIES